MEHISYEKQIIILLKNIIMMAHTLITLANLSKQFPTAMSMVSPNIRYRRSEYAMTFTGREKKI